MRPNSKRGGYGWHADVQASACALAHRGRDATAETKAVDAQRRGGEKQRTGGGKDVGVASEYTLA